MFYVVTSCLLFLFPSIVGSESWEVFDDLQYYTNPNAEPKNHEESKEACSDVGATLVNMASAEKKAFVLRNVIPSNLTSYGPPYAFYIGLVRFIDTTDNRSYWKWADGSLLLPEQSDWDEGFPLDDNFNSGANYVQIGRTDEYDEDFKWRNVNGTGEYEGDLTRCICEKSYSEATAATTSATSSSGNVSRISTTTPKTDLPIATTTARMFLARTKRAHTNATTQTTTRTLLSRNNSITMTTDVSPSNVSKTVVIPQKSSATLIPTVTDGANFDMTNIINITDAKETPHVSQLSTKPVPEGWTLFQDKLFYVNVETIPRNYLQNSVICKSLGGRLAMVKDPEVREFVIYLLVMNNIEDNDPPYAFHIGLTKQQNDNKEFEFRWADDTKLSESNTNWAPGYPTLEEGADYVIMGDAEKYDPNFTWRNVRGYSNAIADRGRLLCEKTFDDDNEVTRRTIRVTVSLHKDDHGFVEELVRNTSTLGIALGCVFLLLLLVVVIVGLILARTNMKRAARGEEDEDTTQLRSPMAQEADYLGPIDVIQQKHVSGLQTPKIAIKGDDDSTPLQAINAKAETENTEQESNVTMLTVPATSRLGMMERVLGIKQKYYSAKKPPPN